MVFLRLIIIDNTLQERAMLTLKNVSKSYHPKKGKVVLALKDISLSFADTGMVFLLGKSGSGKSTLMNIIGGLDSTDQGEVLFLNKQVSAFNQSEYDAYRNTQVGFVFQEFNLIESFSVYQNIALSKRLQNQEVSREEVVNLLETLDLKDEIDRMPYELSGGQKQRISIGRALIKNPKILLADEPTGALDSDTSKQIFELLKSLSKSRLVIIVSHDRDFATAYGDRVIELSDGKVIRDSNPIEPIASNQTMDLQPPHLPLRDAFKIGLSAFLKKPVRMVITMLILTFSFTLFGFLDSITNYSIDDVAINQAYLAGEETITISRTPEIGLYDSDMPFNFGQSQFDQLQSKYPNRFMRPVHQKKYYLSNISSLNQESTYYANKASGLIYIDNELLTKTGYTIEGRLPQNEFEVVIPLHLVETYQKGGYIIDDEIYEINQPIDMLGKQLSDNINLIIVGIIDTHFNKERYLPYLESSNSEPIWFLREELDAINDSSPHTFLYVHKTHIDLLLSQSNHLSYGNSRVFKYDGPSKDLEELHQSSDAFMIELKIIKTDSIPNDVILKPGLDINVLTENQIIIGIDTLDFWLMAKTFPDFFPLYEVLFEELVLNFANENYDIYEDDLATLDLIFTKAEFVVALKDFKHIKAFGSIVTYPLDYEAMNQAAITVILNDSRTTTMLLSTQYGLRGFRTNAFDIEIVGFYEGAFSLVNQTFYEQVQQQTGAYPYRSVLVNLTGNKNKDIAFLQSIRKLDLSFEVTNEIEYMMSYNDNSIVFMQSMIHWVSLGIALFASILFHNFIQISISNKKKDIGILRALGSRRIDIFRIFLSEVLFMSLIISILSLIFTTISIHYFNDFILNYLNLDIDIFWIEFKQVISILTMTIFVSTLSSWLPIHRYSKQKPVDVIKIIES
jgi:ABC-type lipoprotein export system ATPase subunit/ABC-type antimicrobial peptide transport system permease subunit